MKNFIKVLVLLGIITVILIPNLTNAGKNYSESEILENMIKDLKGEFLESDINLGAVIFDEFVQKEKIEAVGNRIKEELGIIGEEIDFNRDNYDEDKKYYSKELISEEYFNHLILSGYDIDDNIITIIVSSYYDIDDNDGETTLFVNLIKEKNNLRFNDIIDKIEKIFQEFDNPVDITKCVIGTIDGKLEDKRQIKQAKRTIKRFKGKIVEEYIDPSIISYSIFSPLVENSIFSGNKKVNLNLAIRYNEYEDKTYIWIGTPIITMGY